MPIAIIPARGGSKRIPKKNIKPFCNRPIIAYSIENALNSGLFSDVIVSTDDEEIAEVSIKYGAVVPFIRPHEISDDYTSTHSVIKHAINETSITPDNSESVCCIYATAPLLQVNFLNHAYKILRESQCSYVFPVTTFAFPILRALEINNEGYLRPAFPEFSSSRSQDLAEHCHDTGQFYFASVETWQNTPNIYSPNAIGIKIPRQFSQDIDTLEDWEYAEMLYKTINVHSSGSSSSDAGNS